MPSQNYALVFIFLTLFLNEEAAALALNTPKTFPTNSPKLVLIGGCPGTGKSTFGMSVALDQGILKCVSTDTVRAVMRSFVPPNISPPLHRSSYAPANAHDDPVESWVESCQVLEESVEELVMDSIRRRQGLVLEGVSIRPARKLIDLWENEGGVATGCLLMVSDADIHKALLKRRGGVAGDGSEQKVKDEMKIASFDRIRKIQEEMIRLAEESNWILMEQKLDPSPLEIISSQLAKDDSMLFKIPNNGQGVVLDNENAQNTKVILSENLSASGKLKEKKVNILS